MSHGSHGASGHGVPRKAGLWGLLVWTLVFGAAIQLAWTASGQFLHRNHGAAKEEKKEEASCRCAEPPPTSALDQAYGALLLLHAHPLEAFEEGRELPLLSWVRVVLPFAWDLVFAGFLAGLVVFRRKIWDLIRFSVHRPRVVVFGWGPVARSLAQAAAVGKDRVVLVSEHIDDEMRTFGELHGVPVVQDSFEPMRRGGHNFRLACTLRLVWAREIVFADADDGRNLESALAVADLASHPSGFRTSAMVLGIFRSLVRLAFGRPEAWSSIRHVHISDPVLLRNLETSGLLERHGAVVFNWDEVRARDAIRLVAPLRNRVSDPQTFVPVHLHVLGDGPLASAVVVEFLTSAQSSPGVRPLVTLISKGADGLKSTLSGLHPHLEEECGRVDPVPLAAPSEPLRRFVMESARDPLHSIVFVVAESDPKRAVANALWLSRIDLPESVRILLPSFADDGASRILSDLVQEQAAARVAVRNALGKREEPPKSAAEFGDQFHFLERMERFGASMRTGSLLFDETFIDGASHRIREKAEIFHEEYSGGKKPWSELAPSLRHSNRCAFRHVPHKLSAIGLSADPLDQPDLLDDIERRFRDPGAVEELARLEHLRWNAERWLAGWRLAEHKSIRDRTSPCLVPWEDLIPLSKRDGQDYHQFDRDSVLAIRRLLDALHRHRNGTAR